MVPIHHETGTLTGVTRRFQSQFVPASSSLRRAGGTTSSWFRRPSRSDQPGHTKRGLLARVGTAVVAATTVVSLAACSSESSVETQPVDVAQPKVELTSAGSGELASVRWKDDGAEQESTVAVTQGFAQRGGNADSDQTFPDTRLEIPMTSTVTSDNDTRVVTSEVGKPHGSNDELNEDIATAQGFISDWSTTATGEVKELKLGAPEKATDTARAGVEMALQQLHSVPIIFPSEDIGKDATWTVESEVEGQTTMTQKVTYTLLSRAGDIVNLKVDVKQVPTVTELDTGGEGALKVVEATTDMLADRVTIDLTKPLPMKGNIDFVTSVTYGDGNSDVRITQQTHRGLEFKDGSGSKK